ncbi:McrC family protein [Catalinimonas niigatensis]|uniref:McrC family protein n=1 Tax=Catalinimonas niigatensis TaxID=1397264 RepID=UPI002666B73B|nr:hypothetical protein [Catalinimonas niigatensis]WPP51116.1 hypothetical protein PZB72_01745 [Catalinimonas niigatensis]
MKKTNPPYIQIFEHESLHVGEERKGVVFTEQHWRELLARNERQYPPYFQIIHKGIRALHYVGLMAVPGFTLEILPKTDAQEKIHWQLFLLDMLQACGKLPHTSVPALLSAEQGKLSDFFINAFLREVEQLCQEGLLRKYRRAYSNEHKFSGRILLHEHVRRNYVHKERVYAEHQRFDTQHILHEVIREALTYTLQLSQAADVQHRIQKLLSILPTNTVKIDLRSIEKLKLGREDIRYQKALEWANFILLKLKPQFRMGRLSTTCFMIDMQQLFEEYVGLQLKQTAPLFGCRIQRQASSKFWKQRSIRPDMVLSTAAGENIILDTKWKMLKHGQPGDADLKQIYIYNQFFKAERGILLYPSQGSYRNYASTFHHPSTSPLSCELYFLDLMDSHSHRLSKNWAEKLLEQMLKRKSISG